MTIQRDLAHRALDQLNLSSVSYQLARYALGLKFSMLPQEVVHQAKRSLLDTMGCAIGGYDAPGRVICEGVAEELGGTEESTIIGSGRRTTAMNATLVNCFIVRYLDFNDLGGGGHNSDSIPPLLAVAERHKKGGKDFLTSMVVSYEIGQRVRESIQVTTLNDRGWSGDTRGGFNMPPALGTLMGLNEEQIANAIGSTAVGTITLNILDAHREEFQMRKNLRFGAIAYNAILNCMLAKRGFTGPVRIVEGEFGWRESVVKNEMDLERLVDFTGWRIMKTAYKYIACNGSSHGHVMSTLAIVKENNLKPEDIAAIKLTGSRREAKHTTALAKKYPRNAETADHSAAWLNAMAVVTRKCTPDIFTEKNYADPVVLDLIEKVTMQADGETRYQHESGGSEIVTKDGRVFKKSTHPSHGFEDDPLSDKEIEDKFIAMASEYMPDKQVRQIIDTCWNAEKLDDMGQLMKLMVFKPH